MSPLMQIFDKQFFYHATQTSMQEWGKSLKVDDDCVEVLCVPSATTYSLHTEIRIKL